MSLRGVASPERSEGKQSRPIPNIGSWESLDARNCLRAIFDYFPARLYVIDQDYRLLALNESRAQGKPYREMIGKKCHQALYGRDTPCPKCLVHQTLITGQVTRRSERRQEMARPGDSADVIARNEAIQEDVIARHEAIPEDAVARRQAIPEDAVARRQAIPANAVARHQAIPEDVIARNEAIPANISDWEISSYPILGVAIGFQAILLEQDVTEKHRLEAILTQSEKLAAVGQLAAGIAHEINNPLTAIIANAQILQRELPPNSDMQLSVDLIARAGARAAQVMRNLLDFARKEEYYLGLTDVNDTIERAVELVQHEIGARGVQLSLDLDPTLPAILASADHLQSVWLNLLMNAIDSLDKLPAQIQVVSLRIENDLLVSITDNGKGILREDLGRIFEPFFTTKAPGRGTGLGLSVSHRIIEQHGGLFRVESQPGEGSAFTVILPALY